MFEYTAVESCLTNELCFHSQEFNTEFANVLADLVTNVQTTFEMPNHEENRLKEMFEYNCLGGKMTRGLTVAFTVQELCKLKNIPFESLKKKAYVVGWAIEFLQAAFLVAGNILSYVCACGFPVS